MFVSYFLQVFDDFWAGAHLQGLPGRGKWSSVASCWPKHRFFMISAAFQAPIWRPWVILWAPFLTYGTLQCQFVDVFFPRHLVTSLFTLIVSRFWSILGGGRHASSIVNISKIWVFRVSAQDLKNDVFGVSWWRHFGALKLTKYRQGRPWYRF